MGEVTDVEHQDFHDAYIALYPTIANYAWSLTRDEDTAHEIAQETFARLFARWNKVEDPGAYGYRIATNLIRASWRSRRDDRLRLLELGREQLAANRLGAPSTTLDAIRDLDIRQVIGTLPRRYRELVLLHYWADLPLPEIAASLGRPVGTVKRQLSEARQLLAAALESP